MAVMMAAPTGVELRRAREALGLTQAQAARAAGVAEATWREWETHERPMRRSSQIAVEKVLSGEAAVDRPPVVTTEQIRWMRESNDLSYDQFALMLNVHPNTVRQWEVGIEPLPAHRESLANFLKTFIRVAKRKGLSLPPEGAGDGA